MTIFLYKAQIDLKLWTLRFLSKMLKESPKLDNSLSSGMKSHSEYSIVTITKNSVFLGNLISMIYVYLLPE